MKEQLLTEKTLTIIAILLIFVCAIVGMKASYDQGYNDGFNDASFEWCKTFNDLGNLANMFIRDLKELDSKANIITELNLIECKRS